MTLYLSQSKQGHKVIWFLHHSSYSTPLPVAYSTWSPCYSLEGQTCSFTSTCCSRYPQWLTHSSPSCLCSDVPFLERPSLTTQIKIMNFHTFKISCLHSLLSFSPQHIHLTFYIFFCLPYLEYNLHVCFQTHLLLYLQLLEQCLIHTGAH